MTLALPQPTARPERLEGLDRLWHGAGGRLLALYPWTRHYQRRAQAVLAAGADCRALAQRALAARLEDLHHSFRRGRAGPADTIQALATLREAARRGLGLEAYPVQLAAALAGLDGRLVEMATGEGKSLVAVLIAALAGWRGRGVHVLTVNDYLAGRDADRFAPFLALAGLRGVAITAGDGPDARRAAYAADITWLTAKEAAADHLRDRLALGGEDTAARLVGRLTGDPQARRPPVQRGLAQAVVDEADSLLIDEAVTPLILSARGAPDPVLAAAVARADAIAGRLMVGEHLRIDHQHRDLVLTPAGRDLLHRLAGAADQAGPLPGPPRLREERVLRALEARHLYHRGRQYVVRDGQVVIVDEATGRLMPDRSWGDGLHQAVEAKEGVAVSPPRSTSARLSFQRFFSRYGRLAGLTGTAAEAQAEVWDCYGLLTVRIPTHRPCRRSLHPARVLPTASARAEAVVAMVAEARAHGRPVLVGTRSVAASEALSDRLRRAGIPHHVLNAVNHGAEAAIIAGAGQRGAITVATNMAGRGTDIILGDGVAALGGLLVIATERHDSARVDRQLIGRAARQGDPGAACFVTSREDELVQRHVRPFPPARLLWPLWPAGALRLAQWRAGALAVGQRRRVRDQDRRLDEQLGFADGGPC